MLALRLLRCVTMNMTIQMRAKHFTDATVFIVAMFCDRNMKRGLFWLLYYLPTHLV